MAAAARGNHAGLDAAMATDELPARRQRRPQPIRVRTDFNPLAVFAPAVRTDANGAAQVTVKLPDNLTRYRVMVVAVDASGQQFGTGEANLTARLPLMVRPSAPRFLNFGDRFELPVVLQNQTDEPMTVDVAVRATNLELTGAAHGLRVTVPARDRVEVRFPAAAQLAGTARLQVAAVCGQLCRRGHRRAAGLHPGHHRSLCHLRRDRRGRGRPAGGRAARTSSRSTAGWKSPPPPPRCRR